MNMYTGIKAKLFLFINALFFLNLIGYCRSSEENLSGNWTNQANTFFNIHNQKNKQLYSTYLEAAMNNMTMSLLLEKVIVLNAYDELYRENNYATKDKEVVIYDDYFGSSYLSDIAIFKDSEALQPLMEYYINYTSNSEVISEFNPIKAPYSEEYKSFYKVGCSNILNSLSFNESFFTNTKVVEKIDSLEGINFALINNTLQSFTFSNQTQTIEYNLLNFNITRKLTDFWLIRNEIYPAIVILDENISLHIFNLTTSVIQYYSTLDLKLRDDNSISQVSIKDDLLIIGTRKFGLTIYKHSNDSWIQEAEINSFYNTITRQKQVLDIIDFVVNDSTIYILVKNFELKIFSLDSMNITSFEFYHPNLKHIDKTESRKNDLSYIGLGAINTSKGSEIFIELNIFNETNPLINKVYLSERTFDYDNIVTIKGFSFIYDDISKSIYMLKRNANPLAPSLVYKLSLGPDKIKYSIRYKLIQISADNDYQSIMLTPVDWRDQRTYIISNIQIPKSRLTCYFREDGEYNVTIIYNRETALCSEGITYTNYINIINTWLKINKSSFGILGYILLFLCLAIPFCICTIISKRKSNRNRLNNLNKQAEEVVYTMAEKQDKDNTIRLSISNSKEKENTTLVQSDKI